MSPVADGLWTAAAAAADSSGSSGTAAHGGGGGAAGHVALRGGDWAVIAVHICLTIWCAPELYWRGCHYYSHCHAVSEFLRIISRCCLLAQLAGWLVCLAGLA